MGTCHRKKPGPFWPPRPRRCSARGLKRSGYGCAWLFDWLLHPKHPPLTFAIVLKEEDRVVGNFSLGYSPFQDADPRLAERRGLALSFVLNEDYWRRGLMTELLRAALDWVFRETDLDFVNTGYFVFNEGSRRVQEKAGMPLFGSFVFERDGKRIPTRECVLFREEWEKARGGG